MEQMEKQSEKTRQFRQDDPIHQQIWKPTIAGCQRFISKGLSHTIDILNFGSGSDRGSSSL